MHDVNDEAFELTGAESFIPMAEPLTTGAFPHPHELELMPEPSEAATPRPPCHIDVKEGCYRIAFKPNTGNVVFNGTLRVDRAGGTGPTTVSGDLYRFLTLPSPAGPLSSSRRSAGR